MIIQKEINGDYQTLVVTNPILSELIYSLVSNKGEGDNKELIQALKIVIEALTRENNLELEMEQLCRSIGNDTELGEVIRTKFFKYSDLWRTC